MNSITTHTYTMNRKVRSITRSTVREHTVRERTVRRVRLHYSFPFFFLKKNENLYTEKKSTEIKSKQLKSG